MAACTPIRPVIKIGLLAPFEGVERRSGYGALAMMRQAIADSAPATVAVIPLALDDSADPDQVERAARKLLQDDAVRAVIGPYDPALAYPIVPILAAANIPWLMPLALDPKAGFVPFDQAGQWLTPLFVAAAEAAATQGSARMVVAGSPVWLSASTATQVALPFLFSSDVTAVQPTDSVLWLGTAEAGAAYFSALRVRYPAVPFFMGPQADSPIFAEHARISGPVSLFVWRDEGYAAWRVHYPTAAPRDYLTYRATQQAIARVLGQPGLPSDSWYVAHIALNDSAPPADD
ncbi:MAG: ABC transporter substrate-binding protein [Caldilineaceae bacterium]|nr:ABC transporter substrate-binding protein [Caldilineaceae bacterium]